MKKIFRIAAVASILMVILITMGCGKKENPETDPVQPESHEEILGTEKLWGSFRIFVPEGMTLTGGSLTDIEDPNSLWIQPKEFGLDCFQITKKDKDLVGKDIKAAKEAYDTTDISSFSAGQMSWTGISYVSGEKLIQVLKGVNGGYCVEVIITGYEYNSDLAMSILKGIQIVY